MTPGRWVGVIGIGLVALGATVPEQTQTSAPARWVWNVGQLERSTSRNLK